MILFTSCSKTEFTSEKPARPSAKQIDLNNDGIIDYVIQYSPVLVFSPDTDEGIIGMLNPNEENEILHNSAEQSLFLRDLEEVKASVDDPLLWDQSRTQIVSIHNNENGDWPLEWQTNSNSVHSTYFLGLKTKVDESDLIGWVELEINSDNGNIEVVDQGTL